MSTAKINGPRVMQATGIAVFILTIVIAIRMASGAPPPSDYARAGLPDAGLSEAREQPDAGEPPASDGLGTSPSWTDIGKIVSAIYLLANVYVAATPTQKDDEALSRVRAALEMSVVTVPLNVRGWFSWPMTRKRPS